MQHIQLIRPSFIVAALLVGGISICGPASATPIANSRVAISAAPALLQTVQWNGRRFGGWRATWPYVSGFIGGRYGSGYSYRGPAYDSYYGGYATAYSRPYVSSSYADNYVDNYAHGNRADNYAYRSYAYDASANDNYVDNYAYGYRAGKQAYNKNVENYAYNAPANNNYDNYAGGFATPAVCAFHFKSYDWATRTYLGYGGIRRPCP